MRKLLAATAALALLAGTSAYAQNEHGEHGGRSEAAPQGGHSGPAPGGGFHPPTAGQAAPNAPHYGAAPGGGYQAQGRQGGAPAFQGRAQGGVAVRPGWGAPGYAPGAHGAPRYDERYFPRVVRPYQQYHWMGGYWRPQRGFYYHHWVYGEFLPFGWFDQSYWVTDYWDYGLPVPPYGYTWVRAGPDVLLINLANGFVTESIYGVFY